MWKDLSPDQRSHLRGSLALLIELNAADSAKLERLDADAQEISKRAMFSVEELNAKAEAAMQRRIEAGIADGVERKQQKEAPAFDQALVGKRIEVLWKYFDKDTNAPHMIWST